MCLVAFSLNDHPLYRLVLIANRDEFYSRPTLPAAFHSGDFVFSGRDLLGGGTWLGVNRLGQMAAITNIRHPDFFKPARRSRGELVLEFLQSGLEPQAFMERIRPVSHLYGGFNLLLFSAEEALAFHSATGELQKILSGKHALSNHALNTDWPKVRRARQILEDSSANPEELLTAFKDARQALPDELPDTGIGQDREQLLSSIFIASDLYGTRCTTLLTISHEGQVHVRERSHVPSGEVSVQFSVSTADEFKAAFHLAL
ncbi:MAG: NRDE family protein [Spirochaetales bacterium]|nr:NRDE family protein [Spirochaetales bacterium]